MVLQSIIFINKMMKFGYLVHILFFFQKYYFYMIYIYIVLMFWVKIRKSGREEPSNYQKKKNKERYSRNL